MSSTAVRSGMPVRWDRTSLELLEAWLTGHSLVQRLPFELETLELLPPRAA